MPVCSPLAFDFTMRSLKPVLINLGIVVQKRNWDLDPVPAMPPCHRTLDDKVKINDAQKKIEEERNLGFI